MTMKKVLVGTLLLTAAIIPGLANADFVLDTGTPSSNTGAPVTVLNASQWVAAEFDVSNPGTDITQLSAYLTQGVGSVGDTFNLDVYSSAGFTGRSNQRNLVYSTTGTFGGNGWNTVSTNWTPSAAGDYWVALQVSSPTQTRGLDLPGAGISTTSGSAPAQAFAVAGTNGQYAVESSPTTPFGIQVGTAPVPLPAAVWLLLSGLGGVGAMLRRKRAA